MKKGRGRPVRSTKDSGKAKNHQAFVVTHDPQGAKHKKHEDEQQEQRCEQPDHDEFHGYLLSIWAMLPLPRAYVTLMSDSGILSD